MVVGLTEKKYFIFDFDGTIANSLPIHEQAFQETLKKYNFLFNYHDYLGKNTQATIRGIFENNNQEIKLEEVESLTKQKRKLANQYYDNLTSIPFAVDFIELLANKNKHLFIGSSGSKMNVNTGLKNLHLHSYFQSVITADDVENSKPSPDIFNKILKDNNILTQQAIVIEDAITGIEAACRAGLDVICIDKSLRNQQQFEANVYFYDFVEMIEIFKNGS